MANLVEQLKEEAARFNLPCENQVNYLYKIIKELENQLAVSKADKAFWEKNCLNWREDCDKKSVIIRTFEEQETEFVKEINEQKENHQREILSMDELFQQLNSQNDDFRDQVKSLEKDLADNMAKADTEHAKLKKEITDLKEKLKFEIDHSFRYLPLWQKILIVYLLPIALPIVFLIIGISNIKKPFSIFKVVSQVINYFYGFFKGLRST